jgi:hypothetical protein
MTAHNDSLSQQRLTRSTLLSYAAMKSLPRLPKTPRTSLVRGEGEKEIKRREL